MQLVKSLFCLVGRDNGFRFAAIQLLSYLVCITLVNLFNDYLVVNLILLIAILPLIGLSSLRRVKDAGLKTTLASVPVLLYLLVMLTIVLVQHPLAYWLLCLSASTVVMFAMLASQVQNGKDYVLGYSGPIDLSELLAPTKPQQLNKRVEPSFAGAASINTEHYTEQQERKPQETSAKPKNEAAELKHQWMTWLTQNTKVVASSFALLLLLLALATWLSLTPTSSENVDVPPTEAVVETVENYELPEGIFNRVTMPDDFDVSTNQYNGLIVSWQVTGAASGEVWSLEKAKGKPGCDLIKFDKGQSYRSISVEVKNNTYYAYFSPLDSMDLIKAIARRNQFSLCDFDFSLKGTQKQLMSVDTYADWLQ